MNMIMNRNIILIRHFKTHKDPSDHIEKINYNKTDNEAYPYVKFIRKVLRKKKK